MAKLAICKVTGLEAQLFLLLLVDCGMHLTLAKAGGLWGPWCHGAMVPWSGRRLWCRVLAGCSEVEVQGWGSEQTEGGRGPEPWLPWGPGGQDFMAD